MLLIEQPIRDTQFQTPLCGVRPSSLTLDLNKSHDRIN